MISFPDVQKRCHRGYFELIKTNVVQTLCVAILDFLLFIFLEFLVTLLVLHYFIKEYDDILIHYDVITEIWTHSPISCLFGELH